MKIERSGKPKRGGATRGTFDLSFVASVFALRNIRNTGRGTLRGGIGKAPRGGGRGAGGGRGRMYRDMAAPYARAPQRFPRNNAFVTTSLDAPRVRIVLNLFNRNVHLWKHSNKYIHAFLVVSEWRFFHARRSSSGR